MENTAQPGGGGVKNIVQPGLPARIPCSLCSCCYTVNLAGLQYTCVLGSSILPGRAIPWRWRDTSDNEHRGTTNRQETGQVLIASAEEEKGQRVSRPMRRDVKTIFHSIPAK